MQATHRWDRLRAAVRSSAARRPGVLSPHELARRRRRDSAPDLSMPATSSLTVISSAAAMCISVSTVMLRSPRSMPPIYVRCMPHAAANDSCEKPAASRRVRTRCPIQFFVDSDDTVQASEKEP